MKEPNYGSVSAHASTQTVQDPTQAKLLSEPKSFRYFAPFLAKTCTASRAAAGVGCNLDTMLYRIRTFLKAGLLEVVRLEKRSGRPIKHYRSVFDSYFVPSSATSYVNYEDEVRQMLRMYEDVIAKELARTRRTLNRQGLRIYRDRRGEVSSHTASSEEHIIDYDTLPELAQSRELAAVTLAEIFTDELLLTDKEARTLLSDLYKLWRENKREPESSREPYLLRVVLVPLES